ncbi:non-canonical purine NTP pyrophosphatase [Paenibacillus hamazuiensis]|uniref:non-canonical purine NTP pyrophosphatase n=1 Tax=Paenibacillus hamazuiensis TaxID=2936508 RepID=UPI00200F418C|nr:non-canonical purine NTP pyrophosphatase [Paenibacillus hamazuiensis]
MQPGKQVVIATRNRGKAKEFASLFREKGIEVLSLADFEGVPDIVEDGATFADNALIKARAVALALHLPALADDSGLCVDKLGGAPGVYSARYSGEGATDAGNNAKLLAELGRLRGEAPADAGAPGADAGRAAEPAVVAQAGGGASPLLSPARFVCALCMVNAAGEVIASAEETCEGAIIAEPRGEGGFGYDPLFYIPELGKTMAELSVAEKNAYSHRGKAIRSLWAQV